MILLFITKSDSTEVAVSNSVIIVCRVRDQNYSQWSLWWNQLCRETVWSTHKTVFPRSHPIESTCFNRPLEVHIQIVFFLKDYPVFLSEVLSFASKPGKANRGKKQLLFEVFVAQIHFSFYTNCLSSSINSSIAKIFLRNTMGERSYQIFTSVRTILRVQKCQNGYQKKYVSFYKNHFSAHFVDW